MKESIYTIPINEVFETRQGCPICAISRTLEQRWADYITGAAMMEPDIRIKTNEQGFCAHHYELTLQGQKRLPVALMLQSRLEHLQKELDNPGHSGGLVFKSKQASGELQGCFICDAIERERGRALSNIAAIWSRETEFQKMYMQQESLCFPDYRRLKDVGARTLRGKSREAFIAATTDLAKRGMTRVKSDIDAFCGLYDYRSANSGPPPGEVASAIESAVAYLTANENPGKGT